MANVSNPLNEYSLLALSKFVENQDSGKKRVLLKVAKDETGREYLEWREQGGQNWGWKDRLELIFTNNFKLVKVLKFLSKSKLGDTKIENQEEVVAAAVEALHGKVKTHNNWPLSRKITFIWDKNFKPIQAPKIDTTKADALVNQMCEHSCKTQTEFKNEFERQVKKLEKELGKNDTSAFVREVYEAKISELTKSSFTPEAVHTREQKPSTDDRFYGYGLGNLGNNCFINASVQALRMAPYPKLKVDESKLEEIREIAKISRLGSTAQHEILETVIDIAIHKENRVRISLNRLSYKFGLKGKEKQAFTDAVKELLNLSAEKQERSLELIIETFKTNKVPNDALVREELSLRDILKQIVDNPKRQEAFQDIVNLHVEGAKKKASLERILETHGLKHLKSTLFHLGYMDSAKRQDYLRDYVVDQIKKILDQANNPDKGKVAPANTTQTLRQLLRLCGLECESNHSQEDAAAVCRIIFELIGVDFIKLDVIVPYTQPIVNGVSIPVPSLERQNLNDRVLTLAIDVENGTPFPDLVNKHKVKEEIDPKRIAETDDATMIELLDRPLTPEEKEALQQQEISPQDTVQYLQFPKGSKLPNILPFQLKRFDDASKKVNKDIGIREKEKLDIAKLDIAIEGSTEKAHYELNSVTIHDGPRINKGHYYTFVRKVVDGNTIWVEYNDSSVIVHDEPADIADVEKKIRLHGYLYFYVRPEAVLQQSR